MNILGVHYGHNASVCLIQDGRVTFCQSEERLNRIKNCVGFPAQTLDYLHRHFAPPQAIDHAIAFQRSPSFYRLLKKARFQPYGGGYLLAPRDLRRTWREALYQTEAGWAFKQAKDRFRERWRGQGHAMQAWLSASLRMHPGRVECLDHHLAHAYSAVPNVQSWDRTLVFTLDAEGDGRCATVNLYADGRMRVLSAADSRHSLGHYYSFTTALLGMKGSEHEFKVMGMAPYARRQYYRGLLDELGRLLEVTADGRWRSRAWFAPLARRLHGLYSCQRFDNIAGAIQELTEELTVRWIRHWIERKACRNVALAGGVFMNVKACQRIAALSEVERLFVVPSAGDETTALGAAVWGHLHHAVGQPLEPVRDLYLGMSFSDADAEQAFAESRAAERYEITRPANVNRAVAELLAANTIVARCSGRMEFGARALGNRSILAAASDFTNVNTINEAIKCRDFWMPFTPSILEEDMGRYVRDHERIFAPYMCITFDSLPEARRDLRAAIHPRDSTVRPQCVVRDWNPDYHELISRFKELTGAGGILNTSFNLHGEPNVCSPQDAIRTLDNSGLTHLALGGFLLRKRSTAT